MDPGAHGGPSGSIERCPVKGWNHVNILVSRRSVFRVLSRARLDAEDRRISDGHQERTGLAYGDDRDGD